VPRVSVNIPAFNAEAFLARALRSVEDQTYGDYEIVLVDDGSTDGTAEIARSFEKVRYVYQAHQGEAEARSRGLGESKGDLVAFLDADDEWLPEKLERQLAFMEERHSEFSYSDSYCTKGGKRVRYSKLAPPYDGQILIPLLEEWLEHAFITNNSVVASTELLKRVGGFDFEAPFRSNTDYGLWLRVALAGTRFDYLDEPLAIYYRGHIRDSSDSVVMLKRYMQALEYFSSHYPFPSEAQALLERTLERTNVALGAKLLKHGRLREAAPYLRHGQFRDLAAKSRLFFNRRLRSLFRRSG
jgi:glycosyltransferase involved in cell wall biosynthesis